MILKNNLQIQEAKAEDIPALVGLLKQLFAIEKDFTFDYEKHARALKMLIEDERCIVAVGFFEGELIAMLTMQTVISTAIGAKSGLIEDFVVDENYKHMGVGSHLLHYMKQQAHDKGFKRLQLVCDNFNENAQEFYSKKEFVKSNLTAWYLQTE